MVVNHEQTITWRREQRGVRCCACRRWFHVGQLVDVTTYTDKTGTMDALDFSHHDHEDCHGADGVRAVEE